MRGRRIVFAALAGVLALAALAGTGCRRVPLEELDGPTSHDTYEVEVGGATSADVRVTMGLGTLKIRSDAESGTLAAADFTYSRKQWEPEVEYELEDSDEIAKLEVKQPSVDSMSLGDKISTDMAPMTNEWDLALAPSVPMDLSVEMGVGEAKLDLGNSMVRTLQVALGAGDATIDLSGDWAEDMDADIMAGVGELTLIVPEDVGVRVWGQNEGVGDYTVEGLERDGDYYVNDAYGDSDVTLDIRLQRGVGDVEVRTADRF